ncbi:unnamed protein product [Tilletia controversa]|uniref:Nuclear speckle splicing regulatory protein 1 N-terminal domain-containing protein n=3 Tax=Tilletia TaxID=13289 RepID=A0A8X7SZA5_9BASI|nr:hypothetical protein CF336_g6638 [Tilletia laevis]KAE8203994.1 hypothetical protein CF328_g1332 [Tilletia controversa]KAE8253145.1 hypothetical protein A4X03_0g5976 [Tilletia caries]KAE8190776.1 hypothetical protein CF335_g6267 [Tilletia laevis]KAE8253411.1 hypothetical protein A4X06_0g1481 [Tilletia controversa]
MAGFSFALNPNRKPGGGGTGIGAGASGSSLGSALRSFGGDDDNEDEQGGAFGQLQKPTGGSRPPAAGSSRQGKEKPLSVFGGDDDDEEDNEEDGTGKKAVLSSKPASSSTARTDSAKKAPGPISRASRLAADQALAHDASIFEYDNVYDAMKTAAASAKQKQKEAEQAAGMLDETGRPAPKYIGAFLEASAQRKRDHERAEAKKIQRERDAEGDEFADKEAFITDAYREQMEAIKKEEEEEAKRKDKTKSKGVQAFYSNLLSEQSAAHDAAVQAANAAVTGKKVDETLPAADVQEESENAVLARKVEAARASGLAVEINDDNQLVDNRSLLSKGLNHINKKKKLDANSPSSRLLPPGRGSASTSSTSRNLSTAQSFNSAASRARQTFHLEAQLVEIQRKREAEDELEREKTKIKLMGVKDGAGDQERTEREEARQKARERALARRTNKSTAGAPT